MGIRAELNPQQAIEASRTIVQKGPIIGVAYSYLLRLTYKMNQTTRGLINDAVRVAKENKDVRN